MKKLLALLLALMMLHLPAVSLAESFDNLDDMIGGSDLMMEETKPEAPMVVRNGDERRVNTVISIRELYGVDTGDDAVNAAVRDLLEALGFRFSHQGSEGEMALVLSGQDILTLGGAVDGDDIYVSSNLLGGSIALSAGDIIPLANRLLDAFVQMDLMTASQAEEIKDMIDTLQEEMQSSVNASMDYVMQMQDLQNLDFSAFETLLPLLMGTLKRVDAPVAPKLCDAADNGITVTVKNDQFVAILRAFVQFAMDNPVFKQYMEATGEFYTEEQLQNMWAFYQKSGLDETEEQFRARHMTVDMALQKAMDSLDGAQLLDGDLTFAWYMDSEGYPVYASFVLPMYDGRQTETLEIVYTRQTVAQGVAHTCNFTLDGETFTIDALAAADSTTINFIATNGMKTMDIIFANAGENVLKAEINGYEGNRYSDTNDKVFSALVEGQWEFTDSRRYMSGKLTITNGYVPEQQIVFALDSDYMLSGYDFSGSTEFSAGMDGVGLVIRAESETTAPQASIMEGNVTRLAELDETALQGWISGVMEGLSAVLGTVISALPESVLMLVISSGML